MWTCESISPGTAVVRSASITTSQASTSLDAAVPTLTMRSPSVIMVSPLTRGSPRSPETMVPILTIATRMPLPSSLLPSLLPGAADGIGKAVARQQLVDQLGGAVPAVGAEAVACGHELGAGVEHLVLGVSRAELRADRVPRRLEELHLAFRVER